MTLRCFNGRLPLISTLTGGPGKRYRRSAPPKTVAMRAVVQRVKSASVTVDGQEISRIGAGLLCFIGIRAQDGPKDADFICRRILNSRLFVNESTGRSWDQNVVQQAKEVLCVSQFTLFNIMKGNKPDFHLAMAPTQAKEYYGTFVDSMQQQYSAQKVFDGKFGAIMDVSLVNDGPVTIILDSETPKG